MSDVSEAEKCISDLNGMVSTPTRLEPYLLANAHYYLSG